MRGSGYLSGDEYLVYRNNMLQDTTVIGGTVSLEALVDMPTPAEVGTLVVAGIFALSALRYAIVSHSVKNQLKEAGEW
jgi:hypothetical protein